MKALKRANEVRLERAEIKRSVGRGERAVADLLLSLPRALETCPIIELLISQRRWGKTRSRQFLQPYGIVENKHLGTLTTRQRNLLADDLREKEDHGN